MHWFVSVCPKTIDQITKELLLLFFQGIKGENGPPGELGLTGEQVNFYRKHEIPENCKKCNIMIDVLPFSGRPR